MPSFSFFLLLFWISNNDSEQIKQFGGMDGKQYRIFIFVISSDNIQLK